MGRPNYLQGEFKWENGKVVFGRKDVRAGVQKLAIWRWKSGKLSVTSCNAVVLEVLWAEQNATSVKCFISEHRCCRRVVYWWSSRERKRGSAGYDQSREVYLCAKPHFSKGWWTLMMVKGRTGVDAWYTCAHTLVKNKPSSRSEVDSVCFCFEPCFVFVSLCTDFSIMQWYIFQKYTVCFSQV